jgi:hypothetical protein
MPQENKSPRNSLFFAIHALNHENIWASATMKLANPQPIDKNINDLISSISDYFSIPCMWHMRLLMCNTSLPGTRMFFALIFWLYSMLIETPDFFLHLPTY